MKNECKNCNEKVKNGCKMTCPNCGVTMCENCAKKTLKICPNCYHDLELN